MTMVAAFPRCRTELACRWSATTGNQAQSFYRHCRPSTPLTAALGLRLDRRSDPLPLAEHPINRPDASRDYPCGPVAAPKSP
jgi:hypothetical protein